MSPRDPSEPAVPPALSAEEARGKSSGAKHTCGYGIGNYNRLGATCAACIDEAELRLKSLEEIAANLTLPGAMCFPHVAAAIAEHAKWLRGELQTLRSDVLAANQSRAAELESTMRRLRALLPPEQP